MNRAKQEPFVMLPKALLESAAWRELGINERRFLDFLLLEHMHHGGKKNGDLLAPYRQLEEFGIAARYIKSAISGAERLGLIDRRRGTGRRPSVYAITWLPLHDGGAPSNRWQAVSAVAPSQGKAQSSVAPYKGKAHDFTKGRHNERSALQREGANGFVPSLGKAQQRPTKGRHLLEEDSIPSGQHEDSIRKVRRYDRA